MPTRHLPSRPCCFLAQTSAGPTRGRARAAGTHAPQPKRRGRDLVLPNPRGGYHYPLWGPARPCSSRGCQRGDPTLGLAQPGSRGRALTLHEDPTPPALTALYRAPCSLPGSRFCPRPALSPFTCPWTSWLWSHRRPFVLGGAHSPECSRHHFLSEACTGGRAFQAAGTASEKALWQEHARSQLREWEGRPWLEKGKLRAGEGGVEG